MHGAVLTPKGQVHRVWIAHDSVRVKIPEKVGMRLTQVNCGRGLNVGRTVLPSAPAAGAPYEEGRRQDRPGGYHCERPNASGGGNHHVRPTRVPGSPDKSKNSRNATKVACTQPGEMY